MSETSEALRQRYQAQLGTDFGTSFHGLRSEWAWGLMRVNEFRDLFSRAEDVELLNAITGSGFTWDIQHILWDDLLLRVCRLTDPLKSGRKHNLTVRQLPSFCKHNEPALCDKVQRRVDTAIQRRNSLVIGGTGASAMPTGRKPLRRTTPWLRPLCSRWRVRWMLYMLY